MSIKAKYLINQTEIDKQRLIGALSVEWETIRTICARAGLAIAKPRDCIMGLVLAGIAEMKYSNPVGTTLVAMYRRKT